MLTAGSPRAILTTLVLEGRIAELAELTPGIVIRSALLDTELTEVGRLVGVDDEVQSSPTTIGSILV